MGLLSLLQSRLSLTDPGGVLLLSATTTIDMHTGDDPDRNAAHPDLCKNIRSSTSDCGLLSCPSLPLTVL
jgi:hypothetical protein